MIRNKRTTGLQKCCGLLPEPQGKLYLDHSVPHSYVKAVFPGSCARLSSLRAVS